MQKDKIIWNSLSNYHSSVIGLNEAHSYAICIPIMEKDGEWNILFEVRALHISHQPGDVCFPGGKVEDRETALACAKRETAEELMIGEEQIEIVTLLDRYFKPPTLVYPYVAFLHDYEGSFSKEEVDHVFTVPLSYFLEHEPEIHMIEAKVMPKEDFPFDKIRGGKDYPWRKRKESVYFYEYEDHIIWGMTAKILYTFVEIYKSMMDDDEKDFSYSKKKENVVQSSKIL